MSQRSEIRQSEIVQFPKFEFTDDEQLPPYKQTLQHRSTLRAWVTPEEVQALLKPAHVTGTERQDEKRKLNWWGVYHVSQTATTLGDVLASPFHPDQRLLYRGQLIRHDYEWDSQALPGTRHEWVLERARTDTASFEAVMALLINPYDSSKQRMVVQNDGVWQQPEAGVDDQRDYFLLAALHVSELTLKTLTIRNEHEG